MPTTWCKRKFGEYSWERKKSGLLGSLRKPVLQTVLQIAQRFAGFLL
jgi:hypothetical protein